MNSYQIALVGILIGIALFLLLMLQYMIQHQTKTLTAQSQMIQNLTNLAASKDLAAFGNLQALSDDSDRLIDFVPLDDQSVANRLAEQYREAGQSPDNAYSQDDFHNEFGL